MENKIQELDSKNCQLTLEKLNLFLDFLKLSPDISYDPNTQKYYLKTFNNIIGEASFSKEKENNYQQLNVCLYSDNGQVTFSILDTPTCFENSEIIFDIEDEYGILKGTLGINKNYIANLPFNYTNFRLQRFKNEQLIENIVFDSTKCYFTDKKNDTRQIIKFDVQESFWEGPKVQISPRNEDKYIVIYGDSTNTYLDGFTILDTKEQAFLPLDKCLEEIKTEHATLQEQLKEAISISYPNLYSLIEEAMYQTEYSGTNLVEQAFKKVCLTQMSEEFLDLCFGQELIKKLKKNK